MGDWESVFKTKGKFFYVLHEDIPKLSKLMKQKSVKKILDLGCGSGRHTIFLAKNGFEVLSVIRSSDKTRHLPVIILTTSSDITDREFAEHYKADRYIPKPLCAEDFKKAVVALIPE